jgi:predicted nucleic acid-binding protein
LKTALDTNIISELLDGQGRSQGVLSSLNALHSQGPLLICGVVYAELHARKATPQSLINSFLEETGIALDTEFGRDLWAEAGRANADYHTRRRAGGLAGTRPVLPDLMIGAHALLRADRLFTLNPDDFSDFPALRVVTL